MTTEFVPTSIEDGAALAELRVLAMRTSLEAIGRFDPVRVRQRFLDTFDALETKNIICSEESVGFFVMRVRLDHILLEHLYIHPEYQSSGLGGRVVDYVKAEAISRSLPVRLGALRGSRSNEFYLKNGFQKTHEDEWDIYYQFDPS